MESVIVNVRCKLHCIALLITFPSKIPDKFTTFVVFTIILQHVISNVPEILYGMYVVLFKQWKSSLGKHRGRWDNNIRMDKNEIGCKDVG
jgi:hypothetical protein